MLRYLPGGTPLDVVGSSTVEDTCADDDVVNDIKLGPVDDLLISSLDDFTDKETVDSRILFRACSIWYSCWKLRMQT